jgi:hypothetical protein
LQERKAYEEKRTHAVLCRRRGKGMKQRELTRCCVAGERSVAWMCRSESLASSMSTCDGHFFINSSLYLMSVRGAHPSSFACGTLLRSDNFTSRVGPEMKLPWRLLGSGFYRSTCVAYASRPMQLPQVACAWQGATEAEQQMACALGTTHHSSVRVVTSVGGTAAPVSNSTM